MTDPVPGFRPTGLELSSRGSQRGVGHRKSVADSADAHHREKSAPSFTRGITMGSEQLRRRLVVVRFQFAELLDTLDASLQ